MAPKLKVLISSSPSSSYPPTTLCNVNSDTPTPIKTDKFEGEISVWVKGFTGEGGAGDGASYFELRGDMTYGIVARGRFLDEPNADEVVFGNVFEKSIKEHLPFGSSIAVKFMNYIDPTLELDIYADKPWALSPTLATMNHLQVSKQPLGYEPIVKEDSLGGLSEICGTSGSIEIPSPGSDEASTISSRRKWLGNVDNRKAIKLSKDVYVGMEFGNGLLDFNTLSAKLPDPFHFSINLLKYWDGQPVTYVCQRRSPPGSSESRDSPVGQGVYWSVAFVIVDEVAIRDLEAKGGKVLGVDVGEGKVDKEGELDRDVKEEKEKEKVEISDDVD